MSPCYAFSLKLWQMRVAAWMVLWACMRARAAMRVAPFGSLAAIPKGHNLLGKESIFNYRRSTMATSLSLLRKQLRGADAEPKVVLHAFDWRFPEAWGAVDALLKGGSPAAAVVTMGEPPPAVSKFRLKSGGLYVVILPHDIMKTRDFCKSLAWLRLKDPYALYVGVSVNDYLPSDLWIDVITLNCSSRNQMAVSPLAMRFVLLSLPIYAKASTAPITYLSFVLYRRQKKPIFARINRLIPDGYFLRKPFDKYITDARAADPINSINDHKKWVWRYRLLQMLHSRNQFLSQGWRGKNGFNSSYDGPDIMGHKTLQGFATLCNSEEVYIKDIGNKTEKGPFKRLVDRSSYVFTMALPLDLDLLDVVEYTLPLSQEDLCLVVRKAERVPFTLVLVLPYQLHTWVCVGLTLLLATLLWPLVAPGELTAKRRTRGCWLLAERFGRAFTDAFGTFVSGGANRKVKSQPERIFLALLLVFSVVLTNAYTGQIMSFLTTPKFYPDITTLKESAEKIKRVFVTDYVDDLLPYENLPESVKTLKDRFSRIKILDDQGKLIALKEQQRTLQLVASKFDEGMMLWQSFYNYFSLEEKNMENGQKLLHLVPQCLLSPNFRAVAVVKGDGFYEVLNSFFASMVEGGFYIHWDALQKNHMFANGVIFHPTGGSAAPRPLSLKQLLAPFLLLAMGLALAGALLVVQMAQWHARTAAIWRAKAKLRAIRLWRISKDWSRRNQPLRL